MMDWTCGVERTRKSSGCFATYPARGRGGAEGSVTISTVGGDTKHHGSRKMPVDPATSSLLSATADRRAAAKEM